MRATTFTAIFLLISVVVAQQDLQRQFVERHYKYANPPVIWVTELVSTSATIDITTTVWVSEGYIAPTSEAKVASTQSLSSTASSSVKQEPAQFFELASSQNPSPTSVYVVSAPATPATALAANASSLEPVKSSSTSTSLVTPAYVPTASPVVAATTNAEVLSAGSSSETCSTRSPCTGDMTYYDISTNEYRSCGYQGIDSTKDKIVAISAQLMGSVSNGNPMCSKTITVKGRNSKTIVAKVVDKCPSYVAHAIDLSRAAFADLESLDVGRTSINWWFNK
ncbi:hypothetical protein BGZ60DRAFT_372632 [Tricladium varicosporioides]|nr:hypothetical protein BGZ60DRAFT_372632 [Hymenoscyphus varicosporioides]